MSSGLKTNLALTAILVAAGAFSYWAEFKNKPAKEKAEEAGKQLLAVLSNKDLESIELIDAAKKIDTKIECRENCKASDANSRWEIVSPIKFKADEGNVNSLLNAFVSARIQETLPVDGEPEAALKSFGLEKEKREGHALVVKAKGQTDPYRIYLGDSTAVGENLYVMTAGPDQKAATVRIVPGFLRTSFDRNLSYWRSKRLFDFGASEVEEITLKNPKGSTDLVRKDSEWLIGGKAPADYESVDTFLTGLVFLNATDFVSDDKTKDRARFGVGTPKYSVTVKLAKKGETSIDLYDVMSKDKQQKLYATVAGRDYIVELDRTNVSKYDKTAESFRFRNLITSKEKDATKKLSVRLGSGEKFEFEKTGSSWKLVSGQLEGFDPTSPGTALERLASAKIGEFMKNRPVPPGNKEASAWTLSGRDGKLIRELSVFGTGEKGAAYVKIAGSETVKLDYASSSTLFSKPADFMKVTAPTGTPVGTGAAAAPGAPQANPAAH